MLEEEFLKPLGLTKYRLAKDIGVPPQRIGDIVAGKRAITADTSDSATDGGFEDRSTTTQRSPAKRWVKRSRAFLAVGCWLPDFPFRSIGSCRGQPLGKLRHSAGKRRPCRRDAGAPSQVGRISCLNQTSASIDFYTGIVMKIRQNGRNITACRIFLGSNLNPINAVAYSTC